MKARTLHCLCSAENAAKGTMQSVVVTLQHKKSCEMTTFFKTPSVLTDDQGAGKIRLKSTTGDHVSQPELVKYSSNQFSNVTAHAISVLKFALVNLNYFLLSRRNHCLALLSQFTFISKSSTKNVRFDLNHRPAGTICK